jgi:hypothetical protein
MKNREREGLVFFFFEKRVVNMTYTAATVPNCIVAIAQFPAPFHLQIEPESLISKYVNNTF